MKKLAVIMSLYKKDKFKYFKKAVDSILEQTFTDFDLFIQCDGVVDKECKKYIYSLEDKRIIFRERQENKGLAKSLNELLLEEILPKNYEYVARMDADDICVSDRFEKQVSFFKTNNSVDIMGSFIEEIDENDKFIQKVIYPINHKEMRIFLGRRNPLAHMTVMFRRSYFDKVGIYPEDTYLDEDTMFWFNGFKNGCIFANIPEVMVRVRVDMDFYKRRNGFKKSYSDFKNRTKIIKELGLPYTNNIWAFGRFIFMSLPFPKLTEFLYKKMRQ